jgi:hypothetical protein
MTPQLVPPPPDGVLHSMVRGNLVGMASEEGTETTGVPLVGDCPVSALGWFLIPRSKAKRQATARARGFWTATALAQGVRRRRWA